MYGDSKSNRDNNKTDIININASSSQSTVTQIELGVVSKLNEFMGASLTGFTNQITNLLMIFGAMVTLLSLLGYLKLKSLSDNIENNRELIEKYKEDIDKKFSDYRIEMKQEIIEEVKQQIVYGLDDAILKVQEHAYKKVEYTVSKLTDEIQKRRFHYQSLIFKINQLKKYEYEEIMKEEIDIDEKISKILVIQSKYNEINNSDIPKLFSKDIEERVIPTARKLSEYKDLRHIIIKLLLKALENDKLNYVEKTQIKDILQECYGWEEKEDEK
jgi:hypothetical protein